MRTVSTAVTTLTGSMRDDVRDDVLYGTMSKLGQKCRQKGKMSFTSAKLASLPDNCVCEDLVQNFMKIQQTVQSLTLRHTRADVIFTSGITLCFVQKA